MSKILDFLLGPSCPFCKSRRVVFKRTKDFLNRSYKEYDCLDCDKSFSRC